MKYLIPLVLLLIAFSACEKVIYEEDDMTTNKYFMTTPVLEEKNSDIIELRLIRSEKENDDRDLERFLPSTIVVPKGEEIKISLLSEKANFFTVDGKGYSAKAGTYTFKADKKGEYEIVCVDCEDRPTALIRVI